METESHQTGPTRGFRPRKGGRPAPLQPLDAADTVRPEKYEEWEDLVREVRQGVGAAIDAREGFTEEDKKWFAEGDRPYSEEPPALKEGEGFTEEDKKWFAEGDRPWEGEDGQPREDGRRGVGAGR